MSPSVSDSDGLLAGSRSGVEGFFGGDLDFLVGVWGSLLPSDCTEAAEFLKLMFISVADGSGGGTSGTSLALMVLALFRYLDPKADLIGLPLPLSEPVSPPSMDSTMLRVSDTLLPLKLRYRDMAPGGFCSVYVWVRADILTGLERL